MIGGLSRRGALRQESGFTIVEVLAAIVILVIGLLGALALIAQGVTTTGKNRVRQQGTNLARAATENNRTLKYAQLTPASVASRVAPLLPGATLSGSTVTVTRQKVTYTLSFGACSMDDPADGTGSHSGTPSGGGSWCSGISNSGSPTDPDGDDYKRVTVTVTPPAAYSAQKVVQTALIRSTGKAAPVVDCVTADGSCPGVDKSYGAGTSSITFNVTTAAAVNSIRWQVNGVVPPAAQLGAANDPYSPSGTSSQFTWILSGVPDGTYQVSAMAVDANGFTGAPKTVQITLNRTEATPPSAFQAGWDERSAGVDTFWNSSVDQDILYYRVYRKFGTNSPALVCQTDPASLTNLITVNSCFDGAAPAPPSPPATCQNPPQSYTTADVYWVVGVDTNPTTGQPRESTVKSAQIDANLCDKPPKAPTGLAATLAGGKVTLTWSAPSAPVDPDSGDTIDAWRIYRWSSALAGVQYPTYRREFVDATNSSGAFVTTFVDQAPDPGGQTQKYCITSVDTRLSESACSNTVTR